MMSLGLLHLQQSFRISHNKSRINAILQTILITFPPREIFLVPPWKGILFVKHAPSRGLKGLDKNLKWNPSPEKIHKLTSNSNILV